MSAEEQRVVGDGFERVPDALRADNLAIRCLLPEFAPELCDGWVTSVDISPRDVKVDGYDRIHFADHIPTRCPECGDRMLAMNGVEVDFNA